LTILPYLAGVVAALLLLPASVLAQSADRAYWDRLFTPQLFIPLLALSIPILNVVFWGLKSVVHTMRGEPEDFTTWRTELDELRARVEALECSQTEAADSQQIAPRR
jgi:hypothetical protein